MNDTGFDVRELDEFSRRILEIAEKDMPNETKDFLRKEGNKLKKATLKKAKQKVKKKSGNYYRGIKRGKVYQYNKGNAVRVYAGKPAYHAHWLEYGHRLMKGRGRNAREVGFVEGYHVFEESAKEFQRTFKEDVKDFIEKITEEL